MAKVKNNVMMRGISGTLGKQLVIRTMKDGSTIISTMPDFSNREFSPGQLTHQSRFQEASAYAKPAAKTNPIYAKLAEGTTKNAYNVAVADWFHPPVIHSIRRQGETIQVTATDNVAVAKVLVSVLNAEGKILEQGEAVLRGDQVWEYRTNANGRISAEAWDFAGNVVRKEM